MSHERSLVDYPGGPGSAGPALRAAIPTGGAAAPASVSLRRIRLRTVSGVSSCLSATDEVALHANHSPTQPHRPSAPHAHATHPGASPDVSALTWLNPLKGQNLRNPR